jgi:hypothetical protein
MPRQIKYDKMLVPVRTQADTSIYVQQLYYGLDHCGIGALFATRARELSLLRLVYTPDLVPIRQHIQMIPVVSSLGEANEA